MQLTKNVFVETGFLGANVSYVITGDGAVMVDTPYRPTDAKAWLTEIETRENVRYLINLEPHDDHFTGNFLYTAVAVAHEKAREIMLAVDIKQVIETIAMIDPDGLSLIENRKFNVPSITFLENLTLYLGKHSFHLMHLPGHTESQIVVFVPEERVVFTGDNVTYKVRGFLHEADPFSWLESLKRIGDLDVDFIIPGHGEVCDKSYLKDEASYIQDCLDTVGKAVDRGWTKDEAIARLSLPDYYPLDEGCDAIAPQLLQLSISNLYDRLSRR
jgi:cyclase